LIRDIDNMGEVKPGTKRAERKDALFNEIESDILPAIEAIAKESLSVDNDVVYRSTKALFLIRKGGVDNIRTARDSFDEVSKTQRVSSRTGDMILSLDMQLNDKEHALEKAKNILSANPSDPMANYIMGSLCLQNGDNVTAEQHLRKATTGKRTAPLAYNDLAEVLRRRGAFEEAEKVAREAVAIMPKLYVAWETLGSILMGAGKSFEEAEKYIEKACELSKDEQGGAADVRMLISLARVQIKRGQMLRAKGTMRVVQSRMKELTEYERKEFEELMKSVR
jgi:tetratricopeptide (TPR) repeat protein